LRLREGHVGIRALLRTLAALRERDFTLDSRRDTQRTGSLVHETCASPCQR
jgi:hypothetical protein